MEAVGDTTTISEAMPRTTEGVREPRWPAAMAFVTGWLLPATTARRTQHMPLAYAWLVHLIAALIIVALIILLVAWSEAGGHLYDIDRVFLKFELIVDEIAEELTSPPYGETAAVLAVALSIEAAFLVLALLVMPWGARDEPLRASFRNALRQTWLRTVQIIPCVFIVGSFAVIVNQRGGVFSYLEYGIPMIVEAGFAAALWLLWGLLRAVGASRAVPPIERPPMCEACGYNLTTIPMDSRCPECGIAVAVSLGPDARAGTPWNRRQNVGCWRAWWQCSVTAFHCPGELGRQVRVISPVTDHRVFLALHLPVIFLIGAAGIMALYVAIEGFDELAEEPTFVSIAAPILGIACVGGAVLFALFAALIVGVIESLRCKRNLLPGAIQVACYLAGFLAVWVLFGAISSVTMVVLSDTHWFYSLEILTGIDQYVLGTWLWLLTNAVWGIWYFVLVARGTAGTKYANR